MTKPKKKSFTACIKLKMTLDVSIEADTLEEALLLAKASKRKDLLGIDFADNVSESDSSLITFGVYSPEGWEV